MAFTQIFLMIFEKMKISQIIIEINKKILSNDFFLKRSNNYTGFYYIGTVIIVLYGKYEKYYIM